MDVDNPLTTVVRSESVYDTRVLVTDDENEYRVCVYAGDNDAPMAVYGYGPDMRGSLVRTTARKRAIEYQAGVVDTLKALAGDMQVELVLQELGPDHEQTELDNE